MLLPIQLLGLILWVVVWPLQKATELMAGFLHNRDLTRLDASFEEEEVEEEVVVEEDATSGVVTR